jgi:hypothetical protein
MTDTSDDFDVGHDLEITKTTSGWLFVSNASSNPRRVFQQPAGINRSGGSFTRDS